MVPFARRLRVIVVSPDAQASHDVVSEIEREGHDVLVLDPADLGDALLIIAELGLRPADRVVVCSAGSAPTRRISTSFVAIGVERLERAG